MTLVTTLIALAVSAALGMLAAGEDLRAAVTVPVRAKRARRRARR